MNDTSSNLNKCLKLSPGELKYQSSEQYLILCLKLCKLIIQNECSIKQLIDFNSSQTIPDTLLLSHLNSTECHKYSHKESHKLVFFVLGAILCFTILTLNCLTLVTLLKSCRLKKSIQNVLIANLSISDFLSGVSFLYPCILNLLTINALETYNSSLYQLTCMIRQYYYLCLAGYSPMITSMLSSMLTLTLLALEKYLAILHPYLYERLIHQHRYGCYLCLIFSWAVSILVSLLPLMGWNEIMNKSNFVPCMFEKIFTLDYILLFTIICCLCALTMLAIYIRIYFIARKHSNQIAKIHSIFIKRNNCNNSNDPNSKLYEMREINSNSDPNSIQAASSSNSTLNQDFLTNKDKQHKQIDSVDEIITESIPKSKILTTNDQNEKENRVELEIKTKHIVSNAYSTNSLNISMKAMKTLLILLLGFYVCWLPLIIYFLAFASKSYDNLTIYILMFIACCNAVIDPIVYAFRNKEFLNALLANFELFPKYSRSCSKKMCTNRTYQ